MRIAIYIYIYIYVHMYIYIYILLSDASGLSQPPRQEPPARHGEQPELPQAATLYVYTSLYIYIY